MAPAWTTRPARPLTAWVVLAVLLVVPLFVLGGWALVTRTPNRTQAAGRVDPIIVPVTMQDERATAAVTIELGEAPGRTVTVNATGTVTLAPEVGVLLDNGTEILRVNDQPVRAMVSAAPLWRPLASGDSGADVERLQEYLVLLGYYAAPADGRFGPAVARAVTEFNADAGLGSSIAQFDLATIAWVGPEPLAVATVSVNEGIAVGPGTDVLAGPPRPNVVMVTEPQGGLTSLGTFGDVAILEAGAAQVAYVPGSGMVDAPADVDVVRQALAPATGAAATVSATDAHEVMIVPASALVQGSDGSLCVYSSVNGAPVAVSPTGGGVGSTHLPPGTPITTVLSNPGRVNVTTPCGS